MYVKSNKNKAMTYTDKKSSCRTRIYNWSPAIQGRWSLALETLTAPLRYINADKTICQKTQTLQNNTKCFIILSILPVILANFIKIHKNENTFFLQNLMTTEMQVTWSQFHCTTTKK